MLPDLIMIVPSRGRPDAAAALAAQFRATATTDAHLVFSLDDDDLMAERYDAALSEFGDWVSVGVAVNSDSMVSALNQAAETYAFGLQFAIGFMGDDHRPRTRGWDEAYVKTLRELGTGIVYGNDLYQRERLPTQCAMTADIVRELGYMAPPRLTHLAVDDAWLAIGRAAECIRYLPDVIVEHMHPVAGKAEWDEGHLRVNAPEMYQHDMAEYRRWRYAELPDAVKRVRALREAR